MQTTQWRVAIDRDSANALTDATCHVNDDPTVGRLDIIAVDAQDADVVSVVLVGIDLIDLVST